MRWLKSTTQKQWVINGMIVPKCITKDNPYLTVEDTEYNKMLSNPVFASLVRAGDVLVLTREPAELQNDVATVNTTNASLRAKNEELTKELEDTKKSVASEVEKQVASFKEDAIAELRAKQDELEKAQAELKELKARMKSKKSE